MTQRSDHPSPVTIGLDLGDRFSHFCALDEAGETIEEGRLAMTEIAFRRRFETAPAARIAIEVGTHSPWVDALLTGLGHEMLVANPRKLRMIFKSDRKNDRLDAERLARVARMDPKLLSRIAHRERSTRADLAVARARDTAVAARTRMVDHVP